MLWQDGLRTRSHDVYSYGYMDTWYLAKLSTSHGVKGCFHSPSHFLACLLLQRHGIDEQGTRE